MENSHKKGRRELTLFLFLPLGHRYGDYCSLKSSLLPLLDFEVLLLIFLCLHFPLVLNLCLAHSSCPE